MNEQQSMLSDREDDVKAIHEYLDFLVLVTMHPDAGEITMLGVHQPDA